MKDYFLRDYPIFGNIDTSISINELADLIRIYRDYGHLYKNRDSGSLSFFPRPTFDSHVDESLHRLEKLTSDVEWAIQYENDKSSTVKLVKRITAECIETIEQGITNTYNAKSVFCWLLDRLVKVAENDSDLDPVKTLMFTVKIEEAKKEIWDY